MNKEKFEREDRVLTKIERLLGKPYDKADVQKWREGKGTLSQPVETYLTHVWGVVEDSTGETVLIDLKDRPIEGQTAAVLRFSADGRGSIHVGRIYADGEGGFILRKDGHPAEHFTREDAARSVILGRGWKSAGHHPIEPD